jgi:glycosyltransferase involved in cell wall biosynthesis
MRLDPATLAFETRYQWRKLRARVRRIDQRVVRLEPAGEPRAQALFSYVLDPLLDRAAARDTSHTHFWESLCMVETLLELGCAVDAVSWTNRDFVPQRPYDLALDVRSNLERWAPRLGTGTTRVLHCDTAHWSFNNAAERVRLDGLESRRGVRLRARRQMPESGSDRVADVLSYLGNDFTRSTYPASHASSTGGPPMVRIPVSVSHTYDWPAGKDFDQARRTFLWLGSGGLVHKGLDLVLEAFAELPGCRLFVCGPISRERDFARCYRRELYGLPNVETIGWIDVASERFRSLARRCGALVYPSSSEGGGASALTCMHAGLPAVLTREASVDLTAETGVLLREATIEAIREAVAELAARSAGELESMSRAAWEWARAHHSREVFAARFRAFAEDLLAGRYAAGSRRLSE